MRIPRTLSALAPFVVLLVSAVGPRSLQCRRRCRRSGRRRLAETAAAGRRIRRLRAEWRVASIGAAAFIAAAAVLGTQFVDTAGPHHGGPASQAVPALSLGSPAEMLNRAADALEKQRAVPEPRDDQWIYTRSVLDYPKQTSGGNGVTTSVQYDPSNRPGSSRVQGPASATQAIKGPFWRRTDDSGDRVADLRWVWSCRC